MHSKLMYPLLCKRILAKNKWILIAFEKNTSQRPAGLDALAMLVQCSRA